MATARSRPTVGAMLGLADRGRDHRSVRGARWRGDIGAALTGLQAQHDAGADPATVLADLADFTHLVTRHQGRAGGADDDA